MAINRQDTNVEGITPLNEGLFMTLVEQIRTRARAWLLAVGIGAAGISGAMADESQVQLAQAEITPVTMTDAIPEWVQAQTITRDTLKSFMDEGLHAQIDAMSDSALSFLTPIMQEIAALQDERAQWFLARGMIALFLAPDISSFDRAVSRFPNMWINLSNDMIVSTRTYLGIEQDRIEFERGIVTLALADRDEIIARQRDRIGSLDVLIQWLETRLAEEQTRLAEEQTRLAEEQTRLENIELGRDVELLRIRSDIERLRALRWSLVQMIEDIETQAARQPA